MLKRLMWRFAFALLLQVPGIAALAAPPNATVVEYYRSDVDHYFMTASPQEQAALDDGVLKGWTRTGQTFFAWTDAARAPPDAQPVCRFYGRPEAGLDSHFYSAFADECAAVSAKFPLAWQFESPAVFYVQVPDRASGACAPNTMPVYRVFDDRSDANHRYLTSLALRASMQASGWIAEGNGPDGVVMCTPVPATVADDVALVDPAFYSTAPTAALAAPVDTVAVTHHDIVLGGTRLYYTATTGHLTAHDPVSGLAEASFFYVAYTADGQDPATRPVTFFYNGGPGSASVWLHLGSFGPKRIATGGPNASLPQPFPLVDNAESLLDTSDLVFVDAVGAGLSEAVAPFVNQSFWSVDGDAAVFRDFVMAYVAANGRASSPKVLFGESYGTTRTAVLARLLETAGMRLSGIVLQSSVLDYNANCGVVSVTGLSCAPYFPTYASVGAHYGLARPVPGDLSAFRSGAEAFSVQTYAPAVAQYVQSLMLPAANVFDTLIGDTGITLDQWQASFNLDPGLFQHRLIPGTIIGRYDARVSALVGDALARDDDPSSTLITPSFAQGIQTYLQGALKYSFPTFYVTLSDAARHWNFAHDGRGLPDTVPDLATAMALNPGLKILSLNGFHDLATPYFQTELDLARLGASSAITFTTFEGGHMTYLDDGSRPLEKARVRALLRAPLAEGSP
ncbi:MAG TPA: peptidase S10 [Casimicrobiaceae bacterium]